MFDSLSHSLREASEPQTRPAAILFNTVPYITLSLVAINCVVFIIMTTHDLWASAPSDGPSAGEFLRWGASFGPLTLSGQWWRLVTACFVHSGVPHLLGNMIVLLLVGWRAERLFGSLRFGLLYLLAGVGGNIAGLYFHQFAVSEGASGAIFGIYGGLFAFLLRERGAVSSEGAMNIGRSAATFVVYSLISGLGKMGIDMEAHIGGLITGFAAGLFLARPVVQGQPRAHATRAAGVAGGGLALAAIALFLVPKSSASRTAWYRQVAAGERVRTGTRDELVFSGTVTRPEAQTMADAMTRAGMFSEPGIIIVFDRSAASGSLSMAMKGDETLSATFDDVSSTLIDGKTVITHTTKARKPLPWNDPQLLGALKAVGPQLASAGGGLPFRVRLLNSS